MLPNENDALVPCPYCQQHHRPQDAACPHCGARLKTDQNIDPAKDGGQRRKLGRVMYGPPNQTATDPGVLDEKSSSADEDDSQRNRGATH